MDNYNLIIIYVDGTIDTIISAKHLMNYTKIKGVELQPQPFK